MPCTDPRLSLDGRYSVDKIKERDPLYAARVNSGLRWRVIRWQVRKLRPQVLDIFQKANNVRGNIQRKIGETEVLLDMHRQAAAAQKKGDAVDWVAVRRAVLRTRPPCASIVAELIHYCSQQSGGVDGKGLHDLRAFYRVYVSTQLREIPGSIWAAAADVADNYLATAIIKTAISCP